MSLITTKRLQQGVFEALASSNRAAGSGGGSGFRTFGLSAQGVAANFVGGITSASWTTIASVSFQVSLPGAVLFIGTMGWGRTAGVTVDTYFGQIQVDSDADWSTGLGWIDGGTMSATAPNDTFTRNMTMVKSYFLTTLGTHTVNLKATVNGDTFQCQGTIAVIGSI